MTIKVPVDYFGVAGGAILSDLMNMSSNKRSRKVAKNNLERLAKASGAVEKQRMITAIGIMVDGGGQQWITFVMAPEKLGEGS